MRTAILFLCLYTIAAAQTTVTGTITDPAGDLLSGVCLIQTLGDFGAAAGPRVVGGVTVPFSGGSFRAQLTPTDSATPSGQYYKATCTLPKQVVAGHTVGPYTWGPRYWLVPTNSQSLDIGTVEITSPPSSTSWQILWQQMAQNGATTGQSPIWNGSSWQPGTIQAQLSFTTTPQDGQYLRWNALQSAWQPVNFVDSETPTGTVDGTNVTFTLTNAPSPVAGLMLFRNGLLQNNPGDYTLSGSTITFGSASTPGAGDSLTACYRY